MDKLPNELLVSIAEWIRPKTLFRIRATCYRWLEVGEYVLLRPVRTVRRLGKLGETDFDDIVAYVTLRMSRYLVNGSLQMLFDNEEYVRRILQNLRRGNFSIQIKQQGYLHLCAMLGEIMDVDVQKIEEVYDDDGVNEELWYYRTRIVCIVVFLMKK